MPERMTKEINKLHSEIIRAVEARAEEWKAAGIPQSEIVPAALTLATHICGSIFARVAVCDHNPADFLAKAAPMIAQQAVARAMREIYEPRRLHS